MAYCYIKHRNTTSNIVKRQLLIDNIDEKDNDYDNDEDTQENDPTEPIVDYDASTHSSR